MPAWTGEKVAKFIKTPPETRINPNGVDVKVSEVWAIDENSVVTINGKERTITPEKKLIAPEQDGFYHLKRGAYEIRIANEVEIPSNAFGILFSRSTLNRLGILKADSAIWDSGYKGFGTQTIFVPIKLVKIHKDDFWFQMAFFSSDEVKVLYEGFYKHEKPKKA